MERRRLIERALFPSVILIGIIFVLALAFDAARAPERLKERARSHGLATADLAIKEIMCTACRAEMKTAMAATQGVAELEATRRGMTIAYDSGQVSPDRLVGVISRLGYHATLRPLGE